MGSRLLLSILFLFALTGCTNQNNGSLKLTRYQAPHEELPLNLPAFNFKQDEAPQELDPTLGQLSDEMAGVLAQKFSEQSQLAGSAAKCESAHLNALRVLGRYEECASEAESCLKENSSDSAVSFEAARCYEALSHFESAHTYYLAATGPSFSAETNYDARVLVAALFSFKTQYENETPDILRKISRDDEALQKILYGYIEFMAMGKSENATEAQVLAYIQGRLPESGLIRDVLVANWTSFLISHRYKGRDAIGFVRPHLAQMSNPDQVYPSLYGSFYRQIAPNFVYARKLYDAAFPYLHKRSKLPTEQNTYTYTELYGSACASQLTQDSVKEEYERIKQNWKSGSVNLETSIQLAQDLDHRFPNKADISALIAGLLEVQGNDTDALPLYWKAHTLCPYYNRAHWGISSIILRERNRQFSDYGKNISFFQNTLIGLPSYTDQEPYFVNWSSLPLEARDRVWFAARMWIPYFSQLLTAKKSTYIKIPFELLSEAPGLSDIRDVRIGAPGSTLEGDNRLWDDVRGLGGENVIADLGEIFEAPHGAYNLVGHEIAHQFHLKLLPENLQACITKLYDQATVRKQFADPYSALNEAEYFAQAVTYYLVPQDAPKRFGLTRAWFEKNDRDVLDFVVSVESSKGDMGALVCPIAAAGEAGPH